MTSDRGHLGRSATLRFWSWVMMSFGKCSLFVMFIPYMVSGNIDRQLSSGAELSCSMGWRTTVFLLLFMPLYCSMTTAQIFDSNLRILRTLPLKFDHVNTARWFVQMLLCPTCVGTVLAIGAYRTVLDSGLSWPHAHIANLTLLIVCLNSAYSAAYNLWRDHEEGAAAVLLLLFLIFGSIFYYAQVIDPHPPFRTYDQTSNLMVAAGIAALTSFLLKRRIYSTTEHMTDLPRARNKAEARSPKDYKEESVWFRPIEEGLSEGLVLELKPIHRIARKQLKQIDSTELRKYALSLLEVRVRYFFVCGFLLGMLLLAPLAVATLIAGGADADIAHPASFGTVFMSAITAAVVFKHEAKRRRTYKCLPVPSGALALFYPTVTLTSFASVILGSAIWNTYVWHVDVLHQGSTILFVAGTISIVGWLPEPERRRSVVYRPGGLGRWWETSIAGFGRMLSFAFLFAATSIWIRHQFEPGYLAAAGTAMLGIGLILFAVRRYSWRVIARRSR